MTNSTDESRFLVLGQTYLYWIAKEVFPYLFGSFCVLELITGVVLNIVIGLMYRKHRKDDTFMIGVIFIVADFVAYVFILLPTIYLSFTKTESIHDMVCGVLGVSSHAMFLFQFGLITIVFVFTIMSVCHEQKRLFPRNTIIMAFSLILVLLSIGLGAVPIVAGETFVFQKSEYRCEIERTEMKGYINGTFSLYFISFIIALVTLYVTVNHATQSRSDKVETAGSTEGGGIEETVGDEQDNDTHKEHSQQTETKLVTVEEAGDNKTPQDDVDDVNPPVDWDSPEPEDDQKEDGCDGEGRPTTCTDIEVADTNPDLADTPQVNTDTGNAIQRKPSPDDSGLISKTSGIRLSPSSVPSSNKASGTIPKVSKKYREVKGILVGDIPSTLHTRNSVAYLLTWLVLFLCWCPYVVFTYIVMYGHLWWDGWLTVALCCGYVGFCVKPMVLLTVRKDLRKKSSELLPRSVTQKAETVGSRLRKVL